MVKKSNHTFFALIAAIIAAIGGILFGYNTSVIAGALPFLIEEFSLTNWQAGNLVGIILIGALLGTTIAGWLSDHMGRKKAVIVSAVIFLLGAWSTGLGHHIHEIFLGRFVSGLGIGISSVTVPLYLSEISPSAKRGAFVTFYQLAITLGILLGYSMNFLFSYSANWHFMFGVGMVPAVLQLLGMLFMPETPNWLLMQGKEKMARKVLSRLRKDRSWEETLPTMKKHATAKTERGWKTLFNPKVRLLLIIGVVLSLFQQVTGINVVIYYAPGIFQSAGYSSISAATLATLGIGIVNVVMTVFALWLLDRVGRRTLLLIGVFGMFISLLVLSGAFFMGIESMGILSIISLMVYVASFAIGLGPITWLIIAEIYPARIRGKAISVAVFVNWGANYIVSLTFLKLIDLFQVDGTFFLYACISIVCFWFAYRFIPETKGKTLDEIENAIGDKNSLS